MKIKEAAKRFEAYDRRTTQKMAEHNRSAGGSVRKPVRTTKGASAEDNWDRAKFIYRKAAQALSAGHPLQDKNGAPTPAAMQFKRWGSKIPKTQEDLRSLKSLGQRLKDRYKPKEK